MTYPHQEGLEGASSDGTSQAAPTHAPAGYTFSPAEFSRAHPFHLLLDTQLCVLQVCDGCGSIAV